MRYSQQYMDKNHPLSTKAKRAFRFGRHVASPNARVLSIYSPGHRLPHERALP
jgi:hypothetical protein